MTSWMSDNSLGMAILLVGLGLIWLGRRAWRFRQQRIQAHELALLRASWGQPIERARDFGGIQSLLLMREPDTAQHLDDQTWEDLDVDGLLAHLDRTQTSPGEFELYRMLRKPVIREGLLRDRDERIGLFVSDSLLRESVRLKLSHLGRTEFLDGLFELLWGDLPPRNPFTPVYFVLSCGLPLLAGVAALLAHQGLPWVTFAFLSMGTLYMANLTIHYRTRRILASKIRSIRYLSRLVAVGGKLGEAPLSGLEAMQEELRTTAHATRKIPLATVALVPERGGAYELFEILQEYISILVLIEVRAFYKILEEIRQHRQELRRLFDTLGQLDAMQAIASFRHGLETYSKPRFVTDATVFDLEEFTHPLVHAAVPNSLRLAGKSCLITGSNMAGKSTLLRAIGANVLLAQTICTCTARSYRASFFQLISSVTTADNLHEGKSLYFTEAERLLQMVRWPAGETPLLCLVDELLEGTNSTERIAASEEILAYLAKKQAIVIAITHEVTLAEKLREAYETYHFSHRVSGDGLIFDYRLRPGAATTTNAIHLLELLEYPQEIVDNARQKAQKGSRRSEEFPE